MEFLIEIVVTAFTLGGVLGAIVALHLSTNLKSSESQTADTGSSNTEQAPKLSSELSPTLQPASIDIRTNQPRHKNQRQ